MGELLSVVNLNTHFFMFERTVYAVNGVSFSVRQGEFVGLVGETGCGKTVTALSVMRLIDKPGRVVAGQVLFQGEDLLIKSESEMRAIRGQDISMVFQQPRLSLNPVFTVGSQVAAVCRVHAGVSRAEARARTLSMFKMVELPHPSEVFGRYPHELSGGMCQRVMIAMALICSPKLIIADEPTTALDVTVQADILELIRQLAKSTDAACLLITHDLGVVAEVCDRVVVLYCGQVVETGPVRAVFEHPHHPYTKALLECCPRIDVRKPLVTIPGLIPDLTTLPSECYYLSRCGESLEACKGTASELVEVGQEHAVRCNRYG